MVGWWGDRPDDSSCPCSYPGESGARVLFHSYENPTAFILSLQYSFTQKCGSLPLLAIDNCSNRIFDYSLISASPQNNNYSLKASKAEDDNMTTVQTSQGSYLFFPLSRDAFLERSVALTLLEYTWEQLYIVLYILFCRCVYHWKSNKIFCSNEPCCLWIMKISTELDRFIFFLCLMKLIGRQVKNTQQEKGFHSHIAQRLRNF